MVPENSGKFLKLQRNTKPLISDQYVANNYGPMLQSGRGDMLRIWKEKSLDGQEIKLVTGGVTTLRCGKSTWQLAA